MTKNENMFSLSAPAFICRGVVLVMACFTSSFALAHTSLENYVRESVLVTVGPGNVDIRINFSFPAGLSIAERKLMDKDGDGKVSKDEQETYLSDLQTRAEQLLRLSINGQATSLIPLDDPALDLQDTRQAEPHSHELQLAYFARVPKDFGVGDTITLDSGLWTDVPLMVSVSREGTDGIRINTVNKQGLRPPSKKDTMFRIVDARCTQRDCDSKKNGKE
jgi:hypothetical protein